MAEHGFETRRPGGCAEHDIGIGMSCHGNQPLGAGTDPRRQRRPDRAHAIERRTGVHGHSRRSISRDLLRHALGVVAGGQRHDSQLVGMRVDHRQRALADRAGRSENGKSLHAVERPTAPD